MASGRSVSTFMEHSGGWGRRHGRGAHPGQAARPCKIPLARSAGASPSSLSCCQLAPAKVRLALTCGVSAPGSSSRGGIWRRSPFSTLIPICMPGAREGGGMPQFARPRCKAVWRGCCCVVEHQAHTRRRGSVDGHPACLPGWQPLQADTATAAATAERGGHSGHGCMNAHTNMLCTHSPPMGLNCFCSRGIPRSEATASGNQGVRIEYRAQKWGGPHLMVVSKRVGGMGWGGQTKKGGCARMASRSAGHVHDCLPACLLPACMPMQRPHRLPSNAGTPSLSPPTSRQKTQTHRWPWRSALR